MIGIDLLNVLERDDCFRPEITDSIHNQQLFLHK